MPDENKPATPVTCCQMRRKATFFLGPMVPEEICGVPDSVISDFVRFDLEPVMCPDGKKRPIVAFRHCPWCGALYDPVKSEIRTTALSNPPEREAGDFDPTDDFVPPDEWTPPN